MRRFDPWWSSVHWRTTISSGPKDGCGTLCVALQLRCSFAAGFPFLPLPPFPPFLTLTNLRRDFFVSASALIYARLLDVPNCARRRRAWAFLVSSSSLPHSACRRTTVDPRQRRHAYDHNTDAVPQTIQAVHATSYSACNCFSCFFSRSSPLLLIVIPCPLFRHYPHGHLKSSRMGPRLKEAARVGEGWGKDFFV